MTLSDLLKKARKGDSLAQRHLYDLFRTKWYMICMRYMSHKSDADDAFQNGLINIFSKIEQYDDSKGEFGAWSCRIIVNDCIMLLRKKGKLHKTEEISENHIIFDSQEDVVDKLSRKDIMNLINKLPEGYKTVFNLYVIEGFTHKEIAETLSINEGTSKSQLFKARKLLKEALEVIF